MFNSMMKRLAKENRKGFTLVELMIVIAIIGILAVVLIPQASKMREGAKLTGVEANMRMVQAHAQVVKDDSEDIEDFADKLTERLGGATDSSIKNPFNQSVDTIEEVADLANLANDNNSVIILTNRYTNKAAADATLANDGTFTADAQLAGAVIVAVFGSSDTKFDIAIYGYDGDGDAITTPGKVKVVE